MAPLSISISSSSSSSSPSVFCSFSFSQMLLFSYQIRVITRFQLAPLLFACYFFFFYVAKVSLIFFMLGMAPVYDVLPPCNHYSEVHTTAQSLAQRLNLCSGMVDGRTMWAWPSVDLYLIHKEDIKPNLLCCCPEFLRECLNSKWNPFTQRT